MKIEENDSQAQSAQKHKPTQSFAAKDQRNGSRGLFSTDTADNQGNLLVADKPTSLDKEALMQKPNI